MVDNQRVVRLQLLNEVGVLVIPLLSSVYIFNYIYIYTILSNLFFLIYFVILFSEETYRSHIKIRGFMNIFNSQMIRAERRCDREEREILDIWLDEGLYLAEKFGLRPYEPYPELED